MKNLLKIFVLALIIFPVTASAGMVRIADLGAEKFFAQIQSEISAKGVPIRITEIWRNSETDIKKYRLYGWRCKYGMKNIANPDGDIIFWTDEQGYVQGLRIHYDKAAPDNNSSFVHIQSIIFHVMTGDDISKMKFYRQPEGNVNGFYVNPKNNKHYCLMIYPRIRTDGTNIVDWGATFWANSNVNDPLEIPQEVFLTEMSNSGSWSNDPSEKLLKNENLVK